MVFSETRIAGETGYNGRFCLLLVTIDLLAFAGLAKQNKTRINSKLLYRC